MRYYPWTLEDLTKRFVTFSKRHSAGSNLKFNCFVFKAILEAVAELHAMGYVHRDLKLDNFLVDS
jgi:serine/threonine protein kinase